MVEKICEIKNEVIGLIEKNIGNRGIERADVNELGKLADIVKDLAEAEEKCMKATYYCTVTKAMEGSSGYSSGGGTGSSAGYPSHMGYGSSRGRMGYGSGGNHEAKEAIKRLMRNVGPEEREHMLNELMAM